MKNSNEQFSGHFLKFGSKCELCYTPNLQTACIIKKTIETVRKHKEPQVNTISILNQTHKKDNILQPQNSCYRLISMLFDAEFQHSHSYKNCMHQEIQKIIRNQLQCDESTLQILCEKTAIFVAERNFQLETLAFQIKNIPKLIKKELYDEEKPQVQTQKIIKQKKIPKKQKPQIRQKQRNIKLDQMLVKKEQQIIQIKPNEALTINRPMEHVFQTMFPFYYFHQNQ